MGYRAYQFPHIITVWKRNAEPDIYGKYTFTVDTIKCRFEQTERTYLNEYGQHERSRAYIFTMSDVLSRGDTVILGDYTSSVEPVDGAFEIKQERHIPNMRGTKTEHRYTL